MRRLAEADRPGLRALMSSAGVDPARLRTSDLSFRLAPRINAAGRLGDPVLALDLLLSASRNEAQPLAEQLEERNRERQQVEDAILRAAAAEIERSGALERGDRVLVAAGEGWHEGVIGIVASRLVDRHARPVVLIALDGERGKGSGRSVSAYDLHAGLAACSGHLERFGGHRAAAGLSIRADAVEQFAAAMRAHGAEHLPEDAGARSSVVDAVVAVGEVSLDLARELARFEPCGYGNPGVNLLVPGAQLMGMQGMGEGGKHLRLQVADASAHCGAVAWGRGGEAESLHVGARHDVVCRLEINDWRGALAPRLVLRDIVPWPAREPVEPRTRRQARRRVAARSPPASRCPWRWPSGPAAARRRWPRSQAAAGPWSCWWPTSSAGSRRCPIRAATAPASSWCARAAATRRCWSGRSRTTATASSRSPTTTASPASRSCASARRTCSCSIRRRTRRSSPRSPRPRGRVQIAAHESEAVFARACVEADALRSVMAVLWRAAAPGCARRRSRSCAPAPPGPTCRRPPTSSTRPSRRSPRAAWSRSRRGAAPARVAGKSDLAASPAYALHEGRRTRALAWLDALLAGRPAHPAAAA